MWVMWGVQQDSGGEDKVTEMTWTTHTDTETVCTVVEIALGRLAKSQKLKCQELMQGDLGGTSNHKGEMIESLAWVTKLLLGVQRSTIIWKRQRVANRTFTSFAKKWNGCENKSWHPLSWWQDKQHLRGMQDSVQARKVHSRYFWFAQNGKHLAYWYFQLDSYDIYIR